MVPTVRPARLAAVNPAAHEFTKPLQLAVWLCETCGIKRPRFS
jgi:hypothetical protein